MKQGHEEISAPLVGHLDNCLGCMACVTACPSGVQYDKLLEDARAQVERNFERPPPSAPTGGSCSSCSRGPGGCARSRRPRRWRTGSACRGWPAGRRLRRLAPRLAAIAAMTPEASVQARARAPARALRGAGEKRGEVALLQGCVQRVFFGHVNRDTARVLAAEGFDVHVPRLPRCCGALPLHAGADPAGARAGQGDDRGARAPRDRDRERRRLRLGDEGLRPRAARRARLGRARASASRPRCATPTSSSPRPARARERRPVPMKVAYHDACHLAHAQGVRDAAARAAALDPRAGAGRAARVGAVLRLGGDLQPGQARAGRRAGRAQGAQPARHRTPRRSPRPTPAARCRSRPTPSGSAARCRCCTRWSCWRGRSASVAA